MQPHRWQPTRLPHPWDSPDKNTGVGCHFLLQCMKVKSESEVAQSCPTLSNTMDCSLPGSSIHGIFQARVLEWGAIAFSKDVFKSSYNDLKFMVQNCKFVCTNLTVYLKLTQHCKSTVLILKKNPPLKFINHLLWTRILGCLSSTCQVFGHFSEKNVAPTYKFSHGPAP